MLSQTHATALAQTRQYDLGLDLLSRLQRVTTYSERIDILEEAEERFDQIHVREHAIRVAERARELSLHCGFDEGYANRLYNATRLHDVGKLFMPKHILEKPGRATNEEFLIIKEHARHGGDLLGASAPEFVVNIARFHHERYDGNGYNNLVGENIPFEARLVQIADVYDALSSKRSYKPDLPEERVLDIMVSSQKEGVMFDPYLLRRFVEMRVAADHDRKISPEMAEKFSKFVESHPNDDLKGVADPSVFEGWEIASGGQRRKTALDDGVFLETRDAMGAVTFRLPEPKAVDVHDVEAADNASSGPRGPRF
ncbi:HD-GYP domain-containing protein [Rhizobium sp. BK176]|uniref:HD-GYP domain-containing protein n=1 Tax=Rhizobium sp. BK176 TaxID=2587071 RepID=UPI002168A26A|nr:HD domain-containing phosphohydrolase [Rhizobium sp. BK176]MCS4089526.1 response regulator RpfG family c-di-GMP phosphodiesterase [Rhizobium sp. BK176]